MVVALTLDIVGSRRLNDREAAQRSLDATIARIESDVPLALRPLHPTVGDEQQGEYPSLESALCAVLLLQLALADTVECRFGIGIGEIKAVPSSSGEIPEGPAWWAAREAIDTVHALQQRAVPHARTWVVAAADAPDTVRDSTRIVNPYLLARDELVVSMRERTRRLAYGRCIGRAQRELADAEGITQSAVSQLLANSGARAVIEGYRVLHAALDVS